MLISPMASPKIFFAPGAAASAARFMESTNSSSWGPYPTSRKPFSAVWSWEGMRILIA
jgi:hypothetical protein